MRNNLRLFLLSVALSLSCLALHAQYWGEGGLGGGVSFYNGDANSTKIFYENHPAGMVFVRLKMSPHWVLKVDGAYGSVSGDIDNFPDNKFPFDEYSFEHDFFNVGAMFEFNFFQFGLKSWDKDVKRHTPYITAGPSVGFYQAWGGNEFFPGLAFGVGYKVKLVGRLNLGIEWDMHKLFKDNFDDNEFGDNLLDDPYGHGHSSLKNNDWYSCAFVYLSFDMFRRRGVCRVLSM